MQASRISKFHDKVILSTTCPHCGARQVNSCMLVCNYCYKGLHDVASLFTDVKARINCFEEKNPWEYVDGYYA